MDDKNSLGLLRRFLWIVAGLIVAGLAISLIADRPSNNELDYADAWREIGGAIVSGGLVAGLILWFEERREEERFAREDRRDNEAAGKAWRRELDIRLISIVLAELGGARDRWLASDQEEIDELAQRAEERQASDTFYYSGVATARLNVPTLDHPGRPFREMASEISSVLWFLREEDLESAWDAWSECWDDYNDVPRTDLEINEHRERLTVDEACQMHIAAVAAEHAAWSAFTLALEAHRDSKYR